MCKRWSLFAVLLGLGIGLGGEVQRSASADDDADRIAKLVKELGSMKFAVRDRAKRELEAIGVPALEALRKAARSSDLETSRRAGELVKKMEDRTARENLLAPKKVRLNLKDTPVLDAVNQLAKQSGYSIQVQGDRTILANRKLTLDTGETTFWQAFDLLCQKGGLVEMDNNSQVNPYSTIRYIRPQGGVLILPQVQPRLQAVPVPAPAVPVPAPLPPPKAGALQNPLKERVMVFALAQAVAQAPVPAAPAQPPVRPAPVKPLPALQIQIQPAPALAPPPLLQVQPGWASRPVPVGTSGQLNVAPGKPQPVPTHYAGAVRIRVLSPQQPVPNVPAPAQPQRRPGEITITLEVTPEPRLQGFQIAGTPQIDRAIDEHGQKLTVPMDPMADPNVPVGGPVLGRRVYYYNPYLPTRHHAQVHLKASEKASKTLKELSGHLPVQMLAPPQALITVENILKSVGKTAKGVSGGSIEVVAAEKQADGTYKVQFRMETPPNQVLAPLGGNVQFLPGNGRVQIQIQVGGGLARVNTNTTGLPALLDGKGKAFQLVQIPQRMHRAVFNGAATQELTMVFRAQDGQGEPARLVLHGQRPVIVPVPFVLRDVPVP